MLHVGRPNFLVKKNNGIIGARLKLEEDGSRMRLTLDCMGTPQLKLDDAPVSISRRAVLALLAYLVVSDSNNSKQRHTRESLSILFWADYNPAKALANLRHTLWEVSQSLGEGLLIAEHEVIYLNPAAEITSDVSRFRSLFQDASQQSSLTRRIPLFVEAVDLYRGPFMDGFGLKDATGFNEWVFLESENLRGAQISILTMLVQDLFALNQAKSAVPYAQRLTVLDPLNEAAHRQLMQMYASTDQQAAALQQYQNLEKLLRKELNLDPQPETRELYKKIRKGELRYIEREKESADPQRPLLKHNLPLNLTTFIGREKEREEIAELLAQNRLVTLTGAGGIGKTRLALQLGQSLVNGYADGVWFIPLDSVADEELVPQRLASSLGVVKPSDQTIIETLISALRNKTTLLILDNCEHVLEGCARLAEDLLRNCPNLKLLATSREVLGLDGESFYPVFPLKVPKSQMDPMDSIDESEAIQLFVERSRLVSPGFALTKESFPVILEICRHLDGNPLAIELAAARVDVLRVQEILKQLEQSFDLLAGSKRSVSPRHQTLRASINWSWNLLTSPERIFMRRLSVFAGGWTFRAAQTICDCGNLELISALVKKSLIAVDQDARYETRYHFHNLVRQYAQEKLLEAEEEKTIRDRHLEFFLEMCQKFESVLRGEEQLSWLERLFVERDNIRAALQWAAQTNVNAGLYLAGRLRAFWEQEDLPEEKRWLLMI